MILCCRSKMCLPRLADFHWSLITKRYTTLELPSLPNSPQVPPFNNIKGLLFPLTDRSQIITLSHICNPFCSPLASNCALLYILFLKDSLDIRLFHSPTLSPPCANGSSTTTHAAASHSKQAPPASANTQLRKVSAYKRSTST